AIAQREVNIRPEKFHLCGVGNPLPGSELGAWAQEQLHVVLNMLYGTLTRLAPRDELVSLPEQEQAIMRLYLSRVEQIVQRLTSLCKLPSKEMIRYGHDFLIAALLFQNLSRDASNILRELVERIPPSLTFARAELQSIVHLLPLATANVFFEQQATREALLTALPGASIIHLSCHGRFVPDHPL